MYFRNCRLWKSLSKNSLKRIVSEQALGVNMWKRLKCLWNLHEYDFMMFLIILREVDFENVSRSFRRNLRGVCLHIDFRWLVSCSRLWEFSTTNWNANIWKTKNFFSIFCSISRFYIKFWTFGKKRWSSKLMYFRNYRLWKSLLENSLKSTVSEQALAVNIWKRRKCLLNLSESAFITFLIILSEVDLESVSPSVRSNPRGLC